MNEDVIYRICLKCFSESPQKIERCGIGQGNYVYIVEVAEINYVVRCSTENNAYKNTVYWLAKLNATKIPVPKVINKGRFEEYEYLILSYFEGKDIGLVYNQLSVDDKKAIAKEVVEIQNKVSNLELENISADWKWDTFIQYILERARERIIQNGYFDVEKVDRLCNEKEQLRGYFDSIKPVAYLDDISSKNLLIYNGRISGIIDIDWMGVGDKLTYAALTNMALLNLEYDTDYAEYILEEMKVNAAEKRAFLFYTLMYCVDFMGERGMQFMDKTVEVNSQVVERLNNIYNKLWNEWSLK